MQRGMCSGSASRNTVDKASDRKSGTLQFVTAVTRLLVSSEQFRLGCISCRCFHLLQLSSPRLELQLHNPFSLYSHFVACTHQDKEVHDVEGPAGGLVLRDGGDDGDEAGR
eukprot:1146191-Pelagomonas_calceolata.AAC.3